MTETGPLFVSSGDLIADRRYKWALDQAARGDFVAAADILAQTVALAPAFATAWFALGAVRDQLGDRNGAIAAFEKARDADPEDYHGARLQLARLGSGDATPAMSEAYVRRLFDQYAERYDTALTERLAYRGPELLREAVETAMNAAGRKLHFGSMLDLGCGTGLAGAAFRPVVDWLVGVDLVAGDDRASGSERPLRSARHRRYRRLSRRRRHNAARHHLVLAADVFVYVNDLAPIFAAVARVLAPDGLFAFTVETHSRRRREIVANVTLRARRPFIRRVLADADLTVASMTEAAVRSEKGVPVDSLVVVAQPA